MESVVLLSEIDQQRQTLRERIAAFQAQLDLLDKLAKSAVRVNGKSSLKKRSGRAFPARTGVNKLIRRIVEDNPGIKAKQVVDRIIEAGIETKADDPRRAFYSSVDTLRRRGHLVKKNSKLFIAEKWKGKGG